MDDLRTKRVYDPDRHVYGVNSWWTTPGGWFFELKVWPYWMITINKYHTGPSVQSQNLLVQPKCHAAYLHTHRSRSFVSPSLFPIPFGPDWRLFFGMLPHCRQHRNAGPMVDWLMVEAPDPIQRFITEECLL